MSKELEIESTYLAREIPAEIDGVEPVVLVDVYVTAGSGTGILRLRKKGDHYEITRKVIVDVDDRSIHEEHTIAITAEEYKKLSACSDLVIEKNRYTVNINGRMADVDVFGGRHAGLVTIDFEFPSQDERAAFAMPDCCLYDATNDMEISPGHLVLTPYDELEPWLHEKGYEKL